MNPVVVEVLRGEAVESRHRGALVVVDAQGRTLVALGEVERPVFPRSAAKVFQALPLVASGAAERLGLDDEELALACASHNGEAAHVRVAGRMLAKAGLDVDALECGAHWPALESAAHALAASQQVPSALHNNCSGKHAGFACLACALHDGPDRRGYFRGYVQPEHPLMREVDAALHAATGCDLATAPRGIDGCSIPTYALPLPALALAYARLGTGLGLSAGHARAAARLRAAVAAAPFMVGGSGRFDTLLMQRLGARVFCKVGAEGVYGVALPEQGLGIAVKIDDGSSSRAAEVVVAAAIQALLPLDDALTTFVHGLSEPVLRNWNGREVGALRPSTGLRELLGPRR